MAKTILSAHDLRRRALAEIRQQPGCHNVQEIAINRVTDERAESNWSLCVLSAGAADANTAARAALHVQSVLRRDYDLMTDITMIDQLTERDRIELLMGLIDIAFLFAFEWRLNPCSIRQQA